jgi:hypothetical protein
MKKKYILHVIGMILIGIVGAMYSVQAQTASTELKINDQSIYSIKVVLDDDRYTITVDSLNKSEENSITVTNFTSSVLEQFVLNTHQKKNPGFLKMDNAIKAQVGLKFMELIAALYNVSQEGQSIAKIELKDEVPVYNKQNYTAVSDLFKASEAQIVFEDGFIKSVIVNGTYQGKNYVFSNHYGIGISTRRNISVLVKQRLFNEKNSNDSLYILLGEVIIYDRILDKKTNDYSPANQRVYISSKNEDRLTLKKTPSPEIFTLNIFSDFVGVNQNNPNGLIQTEFSKRINFFTKRIGLFKQFGIGILTHVMPSFELTKIEQNNREMPLSQYQVNDSMVTNYANPLQILRYSTANVKTEINLIDIQGAALNIHINGFLGMAVTHVNDSIKEGGIKKNVDESINSFLTGGNVKFIFNPESKWSYTMIGSATYIKNLNDQLDYYTLKNNQLESVNNWLLGAEFLVTWNTNDDNKLFGRFRYNWESNNIYNNYSQFQIGYSIKFKAAKPNN